MPSNLSPELLALLQSNPYASSGYNPYSPVMQDGVTYQPNVSRGTGMDNSGNDEMLGYLAYDANKIDPGDPFKNYSKEGDFTGDGTFQVGAKWSDALMPLLASIGMAQFLPGMMGGAAAGAGGAAAGTAAELALAGEGAFGATNALGGAGMFGPAGSAYYAGTGALGAGTGFGTLPAVEVPTWSAAEFAGSQPFSYSAAGGAAGGAAGAAGAGGGGGGGYGTLSAVDVPSISAAEFAGSQPFTMPGSSWMSALGGAKGLIGTGAALAGGLAGAQGTPGTETTRKQELPDYIKEPVEKMLGYSTSLLDKQMAPGALPGYDLMQQKGLGLLQTPQLGNGFSRFFPGR